MHAETKDKALNSSKMLKQSLHEEICQGDIKLSKVKHKKCQKLLVKQLSGTLLQKNWGEKRANEPLTLHLVKDSFTKIDKMKGNSPRERYSLMERQGIVTVPSNNKNFNARSHKTQSCLERHFNSHSAIDKQFPREGRLWSLKEKNTQNKRNLQIKLRWKAIRECRKVASSYLIGCWSHISSSQFYTKTYAPARKFTQLYIHLFFILLLFVHDTSSLCSSACVCKWKGNKQTVECPNKDLTTIPVEIDPGTQVLDLTGNPLVIIPREKFQLNGLINLQKIFAARCKLMQLDDLAFKGLNNLVELDLSNNKLRMIPVAALRHLPSLMRLQMSHNPITKIKNSSFKTLQYLTSLELTGCSIASIEPFSFEGLKNLEWLKLDANKLQTVPMTVVLPKSLHGVNLHNNPWHCDCQLNKLRQWLIQYNVPSPVDPKCNGPVRLRNMNIKSVREDDLACIPKIHPSSLFLDVLEGKNVTFDCHVSSVPDALIKWTFNGQSIINSSLLFDDIGSFYVFEEELIDGKTISYLRIESVRLEHSGIFQCSAENQAGKKRSNFTLRGALPPTEPSPKVAEVDYVVYIGASLVALVILVIILSCILIIRCCGKKYNSKHKLIVSDKTAKKTIDIVNDPRGSSMPKYMQMGSAIPRINGIQHNSISVIDTSPYRGTQIVRTTQTNPDLLANGPDEKKPTKKKVSIVGVEEMDASGVITTRKLDDIAEECEMPYNPEYKTKTSYTPSKIREPFTDSWVHDRNQYPLTSIPPLSETSSRRSYNTNQEGCSVSYGILKHKPWKDTNDIETSNSPKDASYDSYKQSSIPSYATIRRKRPDIAQSHEKSNGQVHQQQYPEVYQFPSEGNFRQKQIKYNDNYALTTNGYCNAKQDRICECCESHVPVHQIGHSMQNRIQRDGCRFDNLLTSCGTHCCYNRAGRAFFNNTLPENYRPILGNPTPPPPAGYGDSEEEDCTEKQLNQWETECALSPSTRILYSPEQHLTAEETGPTSCQDDHTVIAGS